MQIRRRSFQKEVFPEFELQMITNKFIKWPLRLLLLMDSEKVYRNLTKPLILSRKAVLNLSILFTGYVRDTLPFFRRKNIGFSLWDRKANEQAVHLMFSDQLVTPFEFVRRYCLGDEQNAQHQWNQNCLIIVYSCYLRQRN